ncbi:MAG: DUF262 domain-containing protein [Acidobacteriia bacterium]|nr:DUF262 domain-containing protein [Terriglobia bacterium]
MASLRPTKTVFTIAQFLDWQRSGILELKPIFQRREVWKPPAKSQFIDSIVRGYPIPIIFLRQVQDLKSLKMTMEVVDGQQRLRTLISFLDSSALPDYDAAKDDFMVRQDHNESIAGKRFKQFPDSVKHDILDYELSTHVFPSSVGDDVVFRIFARLNSTGLRLTQQEIRNAEYHGFFKSLVYELGFQHLDTWRRWRLFSDDAIARMEEAEAVSEYLLTILHGITAKKQKAISDYYREYDSGLPHADILQQRFRTTLDSINSAAGSILADTSFSRPALFYSLFGVVYDHMYGIGSPLTKGTPKAKLPSSLDQNLVKVSDRIRAKTLPTKIQDAVERSTGDKVRRDLRHVFLAKELHLAAH